MRFVDTSRVRSRFDERVLTRDDVELSVDVYRPAGTGTHPVLVTRTPYDNNRASQSPPMSTAPQVPSDRFKLIASHGFIVVACDVRGRGDSDGEFTPFEHEANDGADVVEWARRLPDCSGRVGVFGSGYAGFAALAAAATAPVDAVAAWSPFGAGDGLPARGGSVRLDWLLWLHVVGGRVPQPADVPPWEEVFRSRPLTRMHEALGRPDAPWASWIEHLDSGDEFWAALDLDEAMARTTAPTLLVSGWWDSALAATLRHWRAATSSPSGAEHRLVVGPWDSVRTRRPEQVVGGVAWGPASVVDPDELLIEWFARHLCDHPAPTATSRVRHFVTGRNVWVDGDEWPGANGVETLWLSSEGRANTRAGDGRLVDAEPAGDAADTFVHDPANPVPWQPGYASFSRTEARSFTLDTSFATTRDDTLVYTSAPVTSPKVVRGRANVHLWAETDRNDTDWVVALEDVFPGGARSVHLAHGVVRAASTGDFAPGVPVGFTIPMTDVAHELQPGHALRLVVVSSLFPLYAVNLGGSHYTDGVEAGYGRQTVHHGPRRPSRIELPTDNG